MLGLQRFRTVPHDLYAHSLRTTLIEYFKNLRQMIGNPERNLTLFLFAAENRFTRLSCTQTTKYTSIRWYVRLSEKRYFLNELNGNRFFCSAFSSRLWQINDVVVVSVDGCSCKRFKTRHDCSSVNTFGTLPKYCSALNKRTQKGGNTYRNLNV